MKREVTFREYGPAVVEDGVKYRGEFLGSFSQTIEGKTLLEIGENAERIAEQLAAIADEGNDIQIWDVPISM